MIMTRGIIKALPPEGSNIFQVEIPLMEDNTTNEAIFNATLCESPGSYNGFEIGDVVIVHFLDNEMNDAIIMGKLYTSIPEEDKVYILANRLKITNSVELPKDTKIDGVSLANIVTSIENVNNVIGGNESNSNFEESILDDYVRWEETERGDDKYFANLVRTMSGEEYDTLTSNIDDQETFNQTLFFLTSPSGMEE